MGVGNYGITKDRSVFGVHFYKYDVMGFGDAHKLRGTGFQIKHMRRIKDAFITISISILVLVCYEFRSKFYIPSFPSLSLFPRKLCMFFSNETQQIVCFIEKYTCFFRMKPNKLWMRGSGIAIDGITARECAGKKGRTGASVTRGCGMEEKVQ